MLPLRHYDLDDDQVVRGLLVEYIYQLTNEELAHLIDSLRQSGESISCSTTTQELLYDWARENRDNV